MNGARPGRSTSSRVRASVAALLCLAAAACGDSGPTTPPASTPAPGRWVGAQRIDGSAPTNPNCNGAIAPVAGMDASGRAVATWLSDCFIWVAGASRGQPWGPPSPLGGLPPGAPANWLWDPALAVNRGGVALVVWATQESAAEGRQIFSRRLDRVAGWTGAERIDGGEARRTSTAYAPSLALDEGGNGLAVWDSEGIVAARLVAAGGWLPPERIAGPPSSVAEGLSRRRRAGLRGLDPAGRGLRAPLRAGRGWGGSLHPGVAWLASLGVGTLPSTPPAGAPRLVADPGFRRSRPGLVGRIRRALAGLVGGSSVHWPASTPVSVSWLGGAAPPGRSRPGSRPRATAARGAAARGEPPSGAGPVGPWRSTAGRDAMVAWRETDLPSAGAAIWAVRSRERIPRPGGRWRHCRLRSNEPGDPEVAMDPCRRRVAGSHVGGARGGSEARLGEPLRDDL